MTPAHPAEEAAAVLYEGGGLERLAIVTSPAEIGALEPAVGDAEREALDHERRIGGLEPVPLALAQGEPSPVGGALQREEEEAEGGRVHDLATVVEGAPLAVHPIGVLAHGTL